MENCNQFQALIYDSIDGLLPNEKRKEVENHIQGCCECSQIYQGVKFVKQSLRALTPIKTSPDFETVLRTRISMERSLSRKGFLYWPVGRPIFAAAGVVVLVLAFFFINSSNNRLLTANQPPIPSNTYGQNARQTNQPYSNYSQTTQQVNYPMDVLELPRNGTAIESDSKSRQSTMHPDSLRSPEYENVNFEF